MMVFYNEIDPFAAEWLRQLIRGGHIADGIVDERSIVEIEPDELKQYTQCHFFAGIGGWSYALRLAGVSDHAPVWTGSCPCQPFSSAGKQRAADDERHLWPAFFRLIRECRPRIVFGEQVAGHAGYAWWDAVATDLESQDYAAAAADIGAHSVGANHRRNRLYWVGSDTHGLRLQGLKRKSEQVYQAWDTKQFKRLVQSALRTSVPAGKCGALVDGIPARVGRLRAYGNAIVPQVAACFVETVMEGA